MAGENMASPIQQIYHGHLYGLENSQSSNTSQGKTKMDESYIFISIKKDSKMTT